MIRKDITVTQFYDDSGECYYLLPSGFENKGILVNESPVDLSVRHVKLKDIERLRGSSEEIQEVLILMEMMV